MKKTWMWGGVGFIVGVMVAKRTNIKLPFLG